MDDTSKAPHCRKCGKRMKEIASQGAVIPFDVVLKTLKYFVHPSSFWYFRCPDEHGGAIQIPIVFEYDDSELHGKHYVVK